MEDAETKIEKPRKDRRESLKATVKPFNSKLHPKFAWVVYWPADEPGKPRQYRRFRLKKAAESFAAVKEAEIKNRGRAAAALNDRITEDAAWAVRKLNPYGVTLRDVINDYLARRREADKSSRVEDAVDEFLAVKRAGGKSARYLADLHYKLKLFAADYGENLMSEITTANIDAWLVGRKVSAVTRNGYHRVLIVFFEWGGKRGYCSKDGNPARAAEGAGEKTGRVPIFTPGEVRVILNTAPAELIPVIALGAFAGLRVEEIRRLDWRAVDFLRKRIDIDGEVSKTASCRYVPMNETLIAWIQTVAKAAGPVAPSNLYRRLWKFHGLLAVKDEKTGRPAVEWKHNALRHSFASYALAKEEDAARVALWLGHASQSMLFKHYRERVKTEEAVEWFAVTPREKKAKKPKLRAVA